MGVHNNMISHLAVQLKEKIAGYLPNFTGFSDSWFFTNGPSVTGCWAAPPPLVTYLLLSQLGSLFLPFSVYMDNPGVPSLCPEVLRPHQNHIGGQIFKRLLLWLSKIIDKIFVSQFKGSCRYTWFKSDLSK